MSTKLVIECPPPSVEVLEYQDLLKLSEKEILAMIAVAQKRIQEQLQAIHGLLKGEREAEDAPMSPFVKEDSVTSTASDMWDIEKTYGRKALSGVLSNDSSSYDLTVTINDEVKITVKKTEVFDWGPERRPLKVSKLRIETTSSSSVPYRLWAW